MIFKKIDFSELPEAIKNNPQSEDTFGVYQVDDKFIVLWWLLDAHPVCSTNMHAYDQSGSFLWKNEVFRPQIQSSQPYTGMGCEEDQVVGYNAIGHNVVIDLTTGKEISVAPGRPW